MFMFWFGCACYIICTPVCYQVDINTYEVTYTCKLFIRTRTHIWINMGINIMYVCVFLLCTWFGSGLCVSYGGWINIHENTIHTSIQIPVAVGKNTNECVCICIPLFIFIVFMLFSPYRRWKIHNRTHILLNIFTFPYKWLNMHICVLFY